MRHRFIALPLAALAILALASAALAGGWAQVTVKSGPLDPVAGEETTIDLNVLQHGVTPVSWPRLTVVATDAISGDLVRTQAQAKGPEGSYVATIVFPSAGDWTLTFDSPELEMEGSLAMNVAPPAVVAPPVAVAPPADIAQPVAAPQTATAVPAAAAASPFDATPLVLVLIAAAAALAVAGLALRSGRASRGTRVPVRN